MKVKPMTQSSRGRENARIRLLIVCGEEGEVDLRILVAQLRSAGVEVETHRELSSTPQRGRWDGVLIDLDSVGPDPRGALREVRGSWPDARVIATGKEPSIAAFRELLRVGAADFVPKPLAAGDILRGLAAPAVAEAGRESITPPAGKGARVGPPPRKAAGRKAGPERLMAATRQLQTLNQTLKKHVSQLNVLYRMGRDISENENWSDALDRFLMALVSYTEAEGAALLLFSEQETRVAARSNFQIEPAFLSQTCQVLLQNWRSNPRGSEIHPLENYRETAFENCLERARPWRFTVVPLRYRNRSFGFLLLEKAYTSGRAFKPHYLFLNTIQTILSEEVANASHISELRQLGRFNQKVLDNIRSGVITSDPGGRIRFSNAYALRMSPWLGSAEGAHFDELFQSTAFGSDFYERLLASRKDNCVLEVQYSGAGREWRPARLSATRMHDDNLNGTVIVAIFEDLTERKLLEREIRRHDRLRVLGQLSAGVAHEIRNPLTGIATSVEVLKNQLQGDRERTKYIDVVLSEIGRLDEIIRNLLNFARPAKPQIGACELRGVASRVVGLLADEARKRGIDLEVQDELDAPACQADPGQLTQVLVNLVLNAIEACKEGDRVRIELRNELRDESAGGYRPSVYARIDVVDTGAGVPESVRSTIFDPFVTTKSHGTGLGLAISQQIIEEHNGTIECEFLERGTRFTIRLAMEPAAASVVRY